MPRRSIATVLVGPNVLFREVLTRILTPTGFRVVASVPHLADLVWTLLSSDDAALLILEATERTDDATAQIRLFKERHASARVAILCDKHRPTDALAAFQAGANAYLTKFASCNAFTKALELVMLGETILPPALLQLISERADDQKPSSTTPVDASSGEPSMVSRTVGLPRLSPRETWILHCIVEGDSNKHIARKIGIAEATVKVHVKAILRKIQLRNRTQAAIWAVKYIRRSWTGGEAASTLECAARKGLLSTVSAVKMRTADHKR